MTHMVSHKTHRVLNHPLLLFLPKNNETHDEVSYSSFFYPFAVTTASIARLANSLFSIDLCLPSLTHALETPSLPSLNPLLVEQIHSSSNAAQLA